MDIKIKKDGFEDFLNQVKGLYNKSFEKELNDFPKSERNKFYKTGDRNDFEKLYFRRRDFLSSCAVLALFNEKYITQLEKILIAICNEYCWALPAHTDGTAEKDSKAIDLFVAETSFTLAEICSVFGDRLSVGVRSRIKEEIEKRLVRNFVNQNFWWEASHMNWASVCGGFTGGALIYLFPDEFQKQKDRILKTMQCYIDGFPQDGTCLEGASYWLYGFSSYVYFADLLYKFTDGKADLLQDGKVQKTAAYMERIFLTGNTTVSFSDADENIKADLALQHFLAEKMPENVHLLPENKMSVWGGNTKWPCFYRTLLWVNKDKKQDSIKRKNFYSENQLIINKENYSFALKGGNNDEPHNHNDLGSFIFADRNGQALCDLGAGRYTKDYFNDEKRYSIFCNSSLSHNVPIINGKGQVAGREHFAKLSYEDNKAVVDITKTYEEEKLHSFVRTVEFKDNSVILTDKFETAKPISVVERFVTLRKPEIRDCKIFLGNTTIEFEAEYTDVKVTENYHIPHEYDKEAIKVYCIDFDCKTDFKCRIQEG